jgi:hypothetical protein
MVLQAHNVRLRHAPEAFLGGMHRCGERLCCLRDKQARGSLHIEILAVVVEGLALL